MTQSATETRIGKSELGQCYVRGFGEILENILDKE